MTEKTLRQIYIIQKLVVKPRTKQEIIDSINEYFDDNISSTTFELYIKDIRSYKTFPNIEYVKREKFKRFST